MTVYQTIVAAAILDNRDGSDLEIMDRYRLTCDCCDILFVNDLASLDDALQAAGRFYDRHPELTSAMRLWRGALIVASICYDRGEE